MRSALAALLAAIATAAAVPDPLRPARRLVRALGSRTPARPGGRRPSRSRSSPVAGPVVLDLVAAVLRAGAPVALSVRVVAECLTAHTGIDGPGLVTVAQRHELALADPAPQVRPWVALLDETLLLARNAGLAPGPLLTSAAEDERRRVAASSRAAAAELGVRVVLPTGLCLLPAFVLLTVVPLVLAVLGLRS
jgi:hypothetical protein